MCVCAGVCVCVCVPFLFPTVLVLPEVAIVKGFSEACGKGVVLAVNVELACAQACQLGFI